jgi:D-glycero-D-manno-heptose 1,7-bisphosphate phosphatase
MGKHEVARRAVFLDRDGVLNKPVVKGGRPYPPTSVEEFELYPDVPEGCARLEANGFLLIVVTNQPDVRRGIQDIETVQAMHQKMLTALPQLTAVEVCWHAGRPWDPCSCRKPRPGMLLRAAEVLKIELGRSFLIGDRWRDIDCAKAAGCGAVFIDRGYSEPLRHAPDWTALSFAGAVAVVLNESEKAGAKGELALP